MFRREYGLHVHSLLQEDVKHMGAVLNLPPRHGRLREQNHGSLLESLGVVFLKETPSVRSQDVREPGTCHLVTDDAAVIAE